MRICYNKHMNNTNLQIAKLPKRVFTKPSVVAIVFFVIILLVLIPNTVALYTHKGSTQLLVLLYLSPLVLPGLFCAYHTGLAIGKIIYTKWHKGLSVSFLMVVVMQCICIALCVWIEIALFGYPVQMCFDICQKVEINDVIISYLIFSTILFLPAYYAICRYSGWYHEFNKKSAKSRFI